MSAVDLCCGDGWFTLPIAKVARRVTAIDLDPALLETARIRLAARAVVNCTFVAADAFEIVRIVHEPVDQVFLANVFHGVPDRSRLVSAVHDVLRPGGVVALVNWHARRREETTIQGEPRGPATELRMTQEQTIASVAPSGLTL